MIFEIVHFPKPKYKNGSIYHKHNGIVSKQRTLLTIKVSKCILILNRSRNQHVWSMRTNKIGVYSKNTFVLILFVDVERVVNGFFFKLAFLFELGDF